MKNYLLVSQCQGKAFKHARRTASGFLARLGQDTWQGTLSTEALKIMIQELKRKASKLSCVVVYDVSGRTRQKVIHIGNRARYVESGEFAFSVHKASAKPMPNPSTQMRLLSKICEMAGYLHDLGKATKRFQEKLDFGVKYNKGLGDPIRHEVVSVLMGSVLLQWLENQDISELTLNPRALGRWCDEAFQDHLGQFASSDDPYAISSQIASTINDLMGESRWAKEQLVFTSTLWLILAHHRMPQGESDRANQMFPGIHYSGRSHNDYFLKCQVQANRLDDAKPDDFVTQYKIKDVQENLALYAGTSMAPALQPWHDLNWQTNVISSFKRLRVLFHAAEAELPSNALTSNGEWATAMALMGRTALVYADYMVSHEKVAEGATRKAGSVYANTVREGERGVYADTLTKHLNEVGKRTGRYFQDMFIKPETLIESFPSMTLDERNAMLPGLNMSSYDARYLWQDKVRLELTKHRSDQPFFGSVMGKTGAGKTRGNIMVMHAMKKDVRFTCALGLRSLVSQTYKAYQEPFIGLSEDNLAILIGESQGSSTKVNQEVQGTGNDLANDSVQLLGDYVLEGSSVCEHPLSVLFDTHKQRSMLTQPIQVMTVDHIAPGASLARSSELKLLLHLMGTDIVLDEIDDYPVESQAALMRMAFISGVFGRSFVISSATATPVIQKAFFEAWYTGYSQGRLLLQSKERPISPKVVLASHVAKSEIKVSTAECFEKDCSDFIAAVAQEAIANARHRMEVIPHGERSDIPAPPSLANLYDSTTLSVSQHLALSAAMKAFHDRFHVISDKVSVSSGFVRLNNVKHAQHLALFLNQHNDSGVHFVPICYHAKMMAFERAQIEQFLLSLNCRKDSHDIDGDQRILYHPAVKAAMFSAKSMGKTAVIFVVCTTSILEVGRDHDYDWAILEPSSTRSLVQSCGRVWRHRTKTPEPGMANVGVLETNILSALPVSKDKKYVWIRHGIEDLTLPTEGTPIVSLTNPVASPAYRALGALGIENTKLVQGSGLISQSLTKINKAPGFWRKMIKTEGALVHAGLCLEIPALATDAFMGAMELAQQHIHLIGIGDEDLERAHPPGRHYSMLSPTRLCSHHADHRKLRDPNSTVVFEYEAQRFGYTEAGNPKQTTWRVTTSTGSVDDGFTQNLLLGDPLPGNLWRPKPFEEYLGRCEPSRRASRLAVRMDEFQNITGYRYLFGIGLIKDFW